MPSVSGVSRTSRFESSCVWGTRGVVEHRPGMPSMAPKGIPLIRPPQRAHVPAPFNVLIADAPTPVAIAPARAKPPIAMAASPPAACSIYLLLTSVTIPS